MKNGFRSLLYPIMFFWAWTAFSMAVISLARYSRGSGKVLLSILVLYTSTRPLGREKVGRRRRVDKEDSLERDRKLEGYFVYYYRMPTDKA